MPWSLRCARSPIEVYQKSRSEHRRSHLALRPGSTLFLWRARLLIELGSSTSGWIKDSLRRSLLPECSSAPTGSTSLPLVLSWKLFSLLYGLRSPADGNSRIFAHLAARILPVQYISWFSQLPADGEEKRGDKNDEKLRSHPGHSSIRGRLRDKGSCKRTFALFFESNFNFYLL